MKLLTYLQSLDWGRIVWISLMTVAAGNSVVYLFYLREALPVFQNCTPTDQTRFSTSALTYGRVPFAYPLRQTLFLCEKVEKVWK